MHAAGTVEQEDKWKDERGIKGAEAKVNRIVYYSLEIYLSIFTQVVYSDILLTYQLMLSPLF